MNLQLDFQEARKVSELQQLTDAQVAKENLDLKSKLESKLLTK